MKRCNTCIWWSPADGNRKFIGICGHREHGGEMTDRTEGGNCMDYEADEAPTEAKTPEFLT